MKRVLCLILTIFLVASCAVIPLLSSLSLFRKEPVEVTVPTTPPQQMAAPTEPVRAPATEPATEAPTEAPAEQDDLPPAMVQSRATLLAIGDVMVHKGQLKAAKSGDGYDFSDYFAKIRDYVAQSDYAVANLETTFGGSEEGRAYSGYPQFNTPDALADAFRDAGFNLLLTANNHTYDSYGKGLLRTQQVITDRGMDYLGTQAKAEDPDYLIAEVNGIRLGMVCYTYGTIRGSSEKSLNSIPVGKSMTERINVFDYRKLDRFYGEMKDHIAAMEQQGAEAVILFIHWGNEYQLRHNSTQAEIAQAMCDLGVDLILGSHPHVVQDVELFTSAQDPEHRTLCVYSLGNAISNMRGNRGGLSAAYTEDGLMARLTFVKYANGQVFLEAAELIPTWVHVRSDQVTTFEILPLDSDVSHWTEAFGLDGSDLEAAENSCERTQSRIGSGMEVVAQFLEERREILKERYGVTE